MSYFIITTKKLNKLIDNLTEQKILILNVEDINPEGKNKIIVNPKGAIKNTTTDSIKNLIKDKFNKQIKFEFEFNNDHISYITFEDLTVNKNGDKIKQIGNKKSEGYFSFDKLVYVFITIVIVYYLAI